MRTEVRKINRAPIRGLAFLTQRQGEIVVCLGVLWLEARRLFERGLSLLDIPGLQQNEPQVIVPFRKVRILPYEIAKDVGCCGGVVVLS